MSSSSSSGPTEARTLYSTPDRERFYWIPDGAQLPPGPLLLRSLKGARLDVDAEAAALYEIDEDRAMVVAREEMSAAARSAGRFLSRTASLLQTMAPPAPRGSAASPASTEAEATGPGTPLAAGGERPPATTPPPAPGTPEAELAEVRLASRSVIDSVQQVLGGLKATLRDSLSADPADQVALRQRLQGVAALVRDAGGGDAAARAIEALPAHLRQLLSSPELLRVIEGATEALRGEPSTPAAAPAGADEVPGPAAGAPPPAATEPSDGEPSDGEPGSR